MRKHTKEFKSSISTFGRELDSKITVLGTELILEKEDLFSITPITNSTLLKTVMKEVDFESKKQIGIGQEINVKSGVKVNGEYEYIDYGNYSVYKSEYKAETDTYSHICYDKMLKTMIDYTPLDITYPINLREYITAIATKCGLEFADKNSAFANYNTSINEDHFSNGNYTFRDVLDYIAQLVGGWLCINDNDELEIRYPELARNYDKVSGENVSFISNVEDEINTIIVDGKSTQTTRSGKNLLPDYFETDRTVNGINYIYNSNGTYNVNGTASGGNGVLFLVDSVGRNDKPIMFSAGTYYTLKSSVSLIGYTGSKYINLANNTTNSFTLSEDTTFTRIYLQVANGKSVNDVIAYPIISTSPITINDYEKYGVSPSPDYPSEIESVGYENLLNPNRPIASSTNAGITVTNNGDGTYTATGTSTHNGAIDLTEINIIKLKKGLPYTNSIEILSGQMQGRIAVTVTNEDETTTYNYINVSSSILSKTVTPNDNKTIKNYQLYWSTSGITMNFTFRVQLEESPAVHPYIPYGKYGIEVKTVGKNLLNLPDGTYTHNGITAVISNGIITINGTSTATSFLTIPINLELESNFSISLNNTAMGDSLSEVRLQIGGSNFRSVSLSVANNKRENISIYGTYTSLLIRISSGVTITNGIIKPQVELGYTTDYEPYQSSSSLFVLDQPLRSLPNGVKDELVIENGRAKIIKRIGKVVLDGSEDTWRMATINGINNFIINNKINDINYKRNVINYISNYFKGIKNADRFKEGTFFTNSNKSLIFSNTNCNSIDEFKTWLSTHNTQVDYELAEPYTETIGEVETLSTFKGVNNVSLVANMQTNMTITYPAEYEELDKHFLKDVNVSFSKKYGAVNSVVFSRGNGSDNIYRKDITSITKNGLTEIKIADNPFLEGDDRENFIQSLFDKINGLEFYIMDVASTGIMYLELGDFYYFNMVEEKPSLKSGLVKSGMRKAQGSSGGKFLCLLMNDEIKITQGLEESIYSDEPEITETDYKTASITDTSIKNAIIQTNKNSAEILLKVNSDEVVSAINLSPENIKISSAKLDIDAIATFTNSKLAEAGSTVINGANITTGSINCDRLNGGTINGQKISGSTISGGSISITKGVYYFNMGTSTSNPNCSGLNVGSYGIKAYSDITATGFAITDSDTGKSQSVNIYDGHGHVHYLTFTGGILTKWEYK